MRHLSCQISTPPCLLPTPSLTVSDGTGPHPPLQHWFPARDASPSLPPSAPQFPFDACFIGGSKMKSSAQISAAEKPSGSRKGCALRCQTALVSLPLSFLQLKFKLIKMQKILHFSLRRSGRGSFAAAKQSRCLSKTSRCIATTPPCRLPEPLRTFGIDFRGCRPGEGTPRVMTSCGDGWVWPTSD